MKKITITRQIQNGAMQIGTESPFQHHLVGIILFLYIYREIQMEQDANAPHLTEESPSYNSERSDCLNHGFSPLIEVSSSYRYIKAPPSTRLWQPDLASGLGEGGALNVTGRGEGRHGADGINWGSGLVLAEPLTLTGAQVSNLISAASIISIFTSPANMEGGCLTMAGYFTQAVGGGLAEKDVPGIPIGYIYNSYKLIRNNYHAML